MEEKKKAPEDSAGNPELPKLQQELNKLKKTLPPTPGGEVQVLAASGNKDMHIALRGDLRKKGEVAPRQFLTIMTGGTGPVFKQGSGRKELAEASYQALPELD